MTGVQSRDFESPDETRTPDKTKVDIVRMGATTVGRFAFEPGWRWSECVKPVAGTDSCQARHVGVATPAAWPAARGWHRARDRRRRRVHHEPGHDDWVVGDEPFVGFEFESKRRRSTPRDRRGGRQGGRARNPSEAVRSRGRGCPFADGPASSASSWRRCLPILTAWTSATSRGNVRHRDEHVRAAATSLPDSRRRSFH